MKEERPTTMRRRVKFKSAQEIGIREVSVVNGFVTSQMEGDAVNHCASIAVANMLLTYSRISYDIHDLTSIYGVIGNGPIVFLKKKLLEYYSDNLVYKYQSLRKLHAATFNENEVFLVCIPLNFIEWHWIVVIGRISHNGTDYFKLFDGWNKTLRYVEVKKILIGYSIKVKNHARII